MKERLEVASMHLKHAIVWVQQAREAKHEELREQHLDEAERLIEYAKGLLDGEAKAR